MNVVVTGASGFIGRNLLAALPPKWKTVAVYNRSTDFPSFVSRLGNPGIQPAQCDLTSIEGVKELAKVAGTEFDLCVYLAANGDPALSTIDPAMDLRKNVLGLVNLLTLVKAKRFLYLSSGAVYDHKIGKVSPSTPVEPLLPYAISKLAAERYVHFFSQRGAIGRYVIVRFFGAYGPHEPSRKIYTRLVEAFAVKKERSFRVRGDGNNLIDAMCVSDAVEALLKTASADNGNMTADLCSGNAISVNQLVTAAADVFGVSNVSVEHEGVVPEYIKFWASPDEFSRVFDFKPRVPLAEGMRRLAGHLALEGNRRS